MAAKSFHTKMVRYLADYQEHLLLVKSDGTAISHISIVHEFLNFLYNHHLVGGIEQITVSMANSKFYADFRRQNKEVIGKEEMKEVLRGYFVFVEWKYGIKNGKLMRGLAREKIG